MAELLNPMTSAETEARRLFVQVAALRERAERAELDRDAARAEYVRRVGELERSRDAARAQRDEAIELLREWARWYAMVGARTVPP